MDNDEGNDININLQQEDGESQYDYMEPHEGDHKQ